MTIDKNKLFELIDTVPAFPASVHKILELTASSDCQPKALIAVIEHDPILTLKILKLVNSAYFGLSREVTSIAHAVVYVGINTIKNVAISVAASGVLPKKNKAGLNMSEFWLHSLKVGVIGRTLAKKKGVSTSQVANFFVAGLLHDIGKVLLAHFCSDDYRPVLQAHEELGAPLFKIERKLLGTSHTELGRKLAEKWQLPSDLIRAIGNHHQIDRCEDPCDLEVGLACANQIADFYGKKNYDADAQEPMLSAIEMQWLGCSVQAAIDSMADLDAEIDKAKMFIDA